MNLFSRFSTQPERVLAERMAQDIEKELPPQLLAKRVKVLSVNRVTKLLERTFDTARQHQEQRQLGMFRRAALANHLKWQLKERGYAQDFVDIVIEGLIVTMTKPRSP